MMKKNNPFKGLLTTLEGMPAEVLNSIGHGVTLRLKEVMKVRKNLVTAGYDVTEADAELDMLNGTKETLGLLAVLGVDEAKTDNATGEQRDIEDVRNLDTHTRNKQQVAELVASVISDNPPVGAIQILNAMEDGERERTGGARENVLKVLRDARSPLVEKVDKGGLSVH